MRLAAPAVAAAAVLLLSACGGDSEEGSGSGGEDQQSESTGGSEGGSEGGSGGGEEGGSHDVAGTWSTALEAPYNLLVLTHEGTATFMNDSGEEICTGPMEGDSLALVCASGNTEFTNATLTQDGDTLTVAWESGTEETYQRADDAAMDLIPDVPGLEELEDLQGDLDDIQQDLEDLEDMGDLGGLNN
ncbi:hypothetical protein ACTWP5_02700 [Streptomyces sp. 4N509B]|uniref:hypothetical protein n=1 Tax=Streptomyces sp. 4N509B TaxID=3457413 RepID=UPI003FCFB14A